VSKAGLNRLLRISGGVDNALAYMTKLASDGRKYELFSDLAFEVEVLADGGKLNPIKREWDEAEMRAVTTVQSMQRGRAARKEAQR
jgi:hypothetical protein